MSTRMFWNCRAAGSVVLALAVSSLAAAKPPDLPSASREAVAPQVEQIPVMPAEIHGEFSGARRLYLIGERCRRSGDFDMAVNCYHEVDLLSHRSTYGRKARRRLHQIETQRALDPAPAGAEEQEVPLPMPQRLDARSLRKKITIELEPAPSAPNPGQAPPGTAAKIPVLTIPLLPRNLTIHVDQPETYGGR